MAQKIPTHYSNEKNKAIAVIATGAFVSFFLLIHLMQVAPIAAYAFSTDINQQSWGIVKIASAVSMTSRYSWTG